MEGHFYKGLDGSLKVFNEKALEFYPLGETDIGRPLSRLRPKGFSFDLDECLNELKGTNQIFEKKFVDEKGQAFLVHLAPVSRVEYLFKIVKMISSQS